MRTRGPGRTRTPTFDANDEIAVMSRELYGEAHSIDDDERNVHYTLDEPDHVVAGQRRAR